MKEKGKKLLMLAVMIICVLMAGSQAWGDVAIDETNFPDYQFRRYVSFNYDPNHDGMLSVSEVEKVKSLKYLDDDMGIESLKGIEYFTALTSLNCRNNKLRELDLSCNTNLISLLCDNNKLTKLNLSGCTALTWLDCKKNELKELALSDNVALTRLYCDHNQLTDLNLSNNTTLEYLYCYVNELTELNLRNNSALKSLECDNNNLTTINFGNNTALTYLICYNNQLTTLDLSNCTALEYLECYDNQLTELDVGNNTALKVMICFNNQLTELDVSNCVALENLRCQYNKLKVLDVSKNIALVNLYCNNNQLTALDLSKNTSLFSYFSDQVSPVLVSTKQDNGIYTVNLNDYVPDMSRLSDVSGNYDSSTGITEFSEEPSSISYKYDTKAKYSLSSSPYMSVTLEKSKKPEIPAVTLPDITQGESYSYTLQASGEGTITWTLVGGNLPAGLSLSEEGVISGIPTESGIFTFTVKAENEYGEGSRELTLKVNTPEIEITTGAALPKGTSGAKYSKTLKAAGADSFTWSISSGSLPNGLSIGKTTGKITGTPTKAGAFTFTVKAKTENSYREKKFTLTIAKALSINGTLNAGIKYAAYTGTLNISGGVSPYTWRISSGALPDGLTIDESTGKISGTPVKAGTFTFKVNVKDKNGASKTKSYTVKITKPKISGTLSNGIKYASYSKTLKASNGTSPYKWSISEGTLPDGLTINESTGKISGTPTKAGTFKFTVKVTDKNDSAATKEYAVKITKPEITGTLSNGIKSASYTGTLKASGGTSPYTWTISEGALPDGLTIGESTGKISGTPTKAGTFNFTVKIKDKNKAAAVKSYTVKITKPSISGTLSAGAVGKSYSKTLKATGGTASYKWTKASGTLPSGLKLGKTTGKISGTPTEAGKFTFKIKVTDANGVTATKSYTVTIKAADASSSENAYVNVYESLSEESKAEDENLITEEEKENETSSLNKDSAVQSMNADPETHVNFAAELQVMSNDVISQGTGRYEDLVNVRVNQPVRFIITAWPREVSDERVYLDDELIEDIKISEGMFTLPAEFVHDDFKVYVKARAVDSELESEELYISATD